MFLCPLILLGRVENNKFLMGKPEIMITPMDMGHLRNHIMVGYKVKKEVELEFSLRESDKKYTRACREYLLLNYYRIQHKLELELLVVLKGVRRIQMRIGIFYGDRLRVT